MTLQIELLETSFQAIAPCGEAFVRTFYERLFTHFPQTRSFCASTDMKEQRKQLLGALALVIQNLGKPEVLTSARHGLGQRHDAYGVLPEHYPFVRIMMTFYILRLSVCKLTTNVFEIIVAPFFFGYTRGRKDWYPSIC
jgi:hemoglobin-like flavoprotein